MVYRHTSHHEVHRAVTAELRGQCNLIESRIRKQGVVIQIRIVVFADDDSVSNLVGRYEDEAKHGGAVATALRHIVMIEQIVGVGDV